MDKKTKKDLVLNFTKEKIGDSFYFYVRTNCKHKVKIKIESKEVPEKGTEQYSEWAHYLRERIKLIISSEKHQEFHHDRISLKCRFGNEYTTYSDVVPNGVTNFSRDKWLPTIVYPMTEQEIELIFESLPSDLKEY